MVLQPSGSLHCTCGHRRISHPFHQKLLCHHLHTVVRDCESHTFTTLLVSTRLCNQAQLSRSASLEEDRGQRSSTANAKEVAVAPAAHVLFFAHLAASASTFFIFSTFNFSAPPLHFCLSILTPPSTDWRGRCQAIHSLFSSNGTFGCHHSDQIPNGDLR